MKTIQVEVKIFLHYDKKLPFTLGVSGPHGYVRNEEGQEVYFDEHDGTSLVELLRAIKGLLPRDTTLHSNNRNSAWVSSTDDDALKQLDGAGFVVSYADHYEPVVYGTSAEWQWSDSEVKYIKRL